MAIESAYQARKILAEPELQAVWTKKDRGKKESDEFERAFDYNKGTNYKVLGLSGLHVYWK
jgi:hypothetical protein